MHNFGGNKIPWSTCESNTYASNGYWRVESRIFSLCNVLKPFVGFCMSDYFIFSPYLRWSYIVYIKLSIVAIYFMYVIIIWKWIIFPPNLILFSSTLGFLLFTFKFFSMVDNCCVYQWTFGWFYILRKILFHAIYHF